jgi:ABC-type glycerol-3-phosphate transport system permease component
MNPKAIQFTQKILIVCLLTVGAFVFILPFANMVLTSIKLDEELAADNFSFWPTAPVPRTMSPYVLSKPLSHIERPPDMPLAEWNDFEQPFREQIHQAVEIWWVKQQDTPNGFQSLSAKQVEDALTQVVGARVLNRISDEARKQGAGVMLAEVAGLVNDTEIGEAFDANVARFCLGTVYVRGTDYVRKPVGEDFAWEAVSPNVSLTPLQSSSGAQSRQQVQVDYNSGLDKPASVRLVTDHKDEVDRLYLIFRGDQSWSTIAVTLITQGRKYVLNESAYIVERKWTEIEMRLPGREPEPLSGRSFLRMKDVGPAPVGSPDFELTVSLVPNSVVGAWWAKISRNYVTAFRQVPIARYIGTSLSLAILSIILNVFGSSFSAYAFARIEFPGRNLLFGVLLATMMIPGQVTMIPNFLINRSLGWYNTLYPLWVPSVFGSAFFIFMLRQFFLGIPRELEEAARMDGCGFLRIYWHVILPMMRPTLLTVAILSFIGSWNNFMGPLIYLNDERLYNLAFGIFKFQLDSGGNSALMMAASFVMILPIIIIFFVFQRYFVQGASLSGLGGR